MTAQTGLRLLWGGFVPLAASRLLGVECAKGFFVQVAQKHNIDSFFGTEILGTAPTLGDNHSSNFDGNIISHGSNHPLVIRSVAFNIVAFSPTGLWGHFTPLRPAFPN